MDKINITDLEVYAYHGVFPEEKKNGQKFYVCADLYVDTREAGLTDDLTKSVHYGEVCQYITKEMTKESYDLIEKCAEILSNGILEEFPLVKEITLQIKKPEAPIGLPFGMVSVTVNRKRHKAYIALGSNMGDSKGYLDMAVKELNNAKWCKVIKCADYIVTKPYGGVEQDDFLNSALELETLLTPMELLDKLHEIEAMANRERIVRWGPRTLDLDILLYDDLVMENDELIIPHVEMHLRDFVLKPMAMLAPNLRHPIYKKTITEMLKSIEE